MQFPGLISSFASIMRDKNRLIGAKPARPACRNVTVTHEEKQKPSHLRCNQQVLANVAWLHGSTNIESLSGEI